MDTGNGPKKDMAKVWDARRRAAARRRHEAWLVELREYGWVCIPPAEADDQAPEK